MLKITDYFSKSKVVTKPSETQKTAYNPPVANLTEQFYDECLKQDYLQCENENCRRIKSELKEQINAKRLKCENLESAIAICTPIN